MKQSVTVGAQLLWSGRYGCNNGRYGCTIVMSYIEINKAVSQWLLAFNLCVSVTWPLTCAFHIPCTHTPEIIDMHRGMCDNMDYYVHVLRRLNKIFPKQLLLKIYKSYVQSKLDHGLSIWGCTTEGNLEHVQRIQNSCARIICKKYDDINTRGIDLVDSLTIQTIRQRRDYFLSVLIFKAIHGLAPHYLCNDVTMIVDVHGYNTRSSENMNYM